MCVCEREITNEKHKLFLLPFQNYFFFFFSSLSLSLSLNICLPFYCSCFHLKVFVCETCWAFVLTAFFFDFLSSATLFFPFHSSILSFIHSFIHSFIRVLSNRTMVDQLIQNQRIRTTLAKAKEIKPLADKMVTLGKRVCLLSFF